MNIKILKLVNGDEIICDLKEAGIFFLNNPAKIVMFPNEDHSEMELALVPWCQYTDKTEFEIEASHVIIATDPPEGLRNLYNDQFGTGLVTPPSDIIL